MRKILLTGASGFLGGHIWSRAQHHWQVLGICHRNASALPGLQPLDLTREAAVQQALAQFKPEVIIHTAANANLDDCEKNQLQAQAINIDAVARLLRYSHATGSRFIFISTDMVFDGERGMYCEHDDISPLSYYGRSKVLAEQLIAETGGHFVIVRAALIYGRPRGGGSSFSQWIEDRLKSKRPVPLYFDQYRSPVLADNLAEMILELAEHEFTGILHCAGSDRIDRYTFGQQLCRIAGYDASLLRRVSMTEDHPPAPRPKDISLSTALAAQVLRTKLLSSEEGLSRMLSS